MINCKISDCTNKYKSTGYCNTHWKRWKKHGDPLIAYEHRMCMVDNCAGKHHAQGMCSTHYFKWLKQGSPVFEQEYPSVLERFLKRVKMTTFCWEWTGYIHRCGYGTFTIGMVKRNAHRFAYELFIGKIPDGLEIDHLCRNKLCVNPDHLEAVSHLENMRRMMAARRGAPILVG